MFVYILLGLALASTLVFALPAKAKLFYTSSLMFCLALFALIVSSQVLLTAGSLAFTANYDIVFGRSLLAVDNFSAFFLVLISISVISVTIYSLGYLKDYLKSKTPAQISLHLMSLVLLAVSMVFVVMCRDAYSFLFSWELMTISSFLLILFDAQKKEVRRAAMNYLVLMHIGFIFILIGFVTLTAAGLLPSFDSLRTYFTNENGILLFIIFLVGFGLKAGIFPLHTWLPEAHPAAPAHVSALMSGVMIKMGVYGVLRVLSFTADSMFVSGLILFIVGIITGLWGAVMAAVQNDMKRLLAYSSIENIGIIFIAIGAAAVGYAAGNTYLALFAMSGAILHTLNHSFFKTLLFFGAGNVYSAVHTTSLDALGGLSRKMPITAVLFLVGTVAICSLPPLGGFVSEYLIYYGFFDSIGGAREAVIASLCGLVAVSLIGGIVLLAFTKLYGVTFLGSPRSHAVDHAREVGKSRILACAIPAAGIIIVGLAPSLFIDSIFELSGELFGINDTEVFFAFPYKQMNSISMTAFIFIFLAALLLYYRKSKLEHRKVDKTPVWGCGFTSVSHKMQYSGESFSEGLYGISSSLTRAGSAGEVVDKNEIFPDKHSFDIKHNDKVTNLFSRWLKSLLRRANDYTVRFNTGKVNHYILYSLLFLALILLLSVTKVI